MHLIFYRTRKPVVEGTATDRGNRLVLIIYETEGGNLDARNRVAFVDCVSRGPRNDESLSVSSAACPPLRVIRGGPLLDSASSPPLWLNRCAFFSVIARFVLPSRRNFSHSST